MGDSDRGVCPDGVAVVEVEADEAGPLRLGAFVEVDMGTMSHPRLRAKALRYLAYANECQWRGRWECCPPVLLATTTEQRAQTFLDGVERLRSGRLRNLHWTRSEEARELVVAACAEMGDPDAAVREPVWRTGADAAPVRLADLLAGTASAALQRRREADEQRRADEEWRRRRQRGEQWARIASGHAVRQVADNLGDPALADGFEAMLRQAEMTGDDAHWDDAFVDGHLWLVEVLAPWCGCFPPERPVPAAVRAVLMSARARAWREQAEVVAEAHRSHPAGHAPRRRAAALLAAGRLLGPSLLEAAVQPERPDALRAWGDYVAERESAVECRRRALGVVDRLRVSREALMAEHDAHRLATCAGCGSLAPGDWRHGVQGDCRRCGGRLVPLAERRRVPETAESMAVVEAALARGLPPEVTG